MTALPDLNLRQRVTFTDSTAVLIVEGFFRKNLEPWTAAVRFERDPRSTTFQYPVDQLRPEPINLLTIRSKGTS